MFKSFGVGYVLNKRNNIGKILITTVSAELDFEFYCLDNIYYSLRHRIVLPEKVADIFFKTNSKIFILEKSKKYNENIEFLNNVTEYLIKKQNKDALCFNENSFTLKKQISFYSNTKKLIEFLEKQFQLKIPHEDFVDSIFFSLLGLNLQIPNMRIFKYNYIDKLQNKVKDYSTVSLEDLNFIKMK